MLSSAASYDLIVVPAGTGTRAPPAPGSSSGSPSRPSAPGGNRLDLDPRLPSLTLSQGATLEINAGSTSIPIQDLAKYTYKWTLKNKATGQTVKTAEGQGVSLPLTTPDSLQLQVAVVDPVSRNNATGSSNLKVLPRPEGSDPLPIVVGNCGPFRWTPEQPTRLSCKNIEVQTADGEPVNVPVVWAWRVTKLQDQSITTAIGPTADFGELEVGDYVVEAALGVNGPPTSTNTIYFLSTYLIIRSGGSSAGGSSSGGTRSGSSRTSAGAGVRAGGGAASSTTTDGLEVGALKPNRKKQGSSSKQHLSKEQVQAAWRQALQAGKQKTPRQEQELVTVELAGFLGDADSTGTGAGAGASAAPGGESSDEGWQQWQREEAGDMGSAVEADTPAPSPLREQQQQQPPKPKAKRKQHLPPSPTAAAQEQLPEQSQSQQQQLHHPKPKRKQQPLPLPPEDAAPSADNPQQLLQQSDHGQQLLKPKRKRQSLPPADALQHGEAHGERQEQQAPVQLQQQPQPQQPRPKRKQQPAPVGSVQQAEQEQRQPQQQQQLQRVALHRAVTGPTLKPRLAATSAAAGGGDVRHVDGFGVAASASRPVLRPKMASTSADDASNAAASASTGRPALQPRMAAASSSSSSRRRSAGHADAAT